MERPVSESLVIPNVYAIVHDKSDLNLILLQERWKPKSDPLNSGKLELPGGKWRAFESAFECLKREVEEETGVLVEELYHTATIHRDRAEHQCVETTVPFAVVQMLEGPYPSALTVFRCSAKGRPASSGDGSRNAAWWRANDIESLIANSPERFTMLSLAALKQLLEILPSNG